MAKNFKPSLKKMFLLVFLIILVAVLGIAFCNAWIFLTDNRFVFQNPDSLPSRDMGLVLGTAKTRADGLLNLHFRKRMEAAAMLYRTGKVRHFILSGDNHIRGYDEPTDMKETLIELGVPESSLTLDYAGFRTLDSVVRAREIFDQDRITIITDDFHAYRAVFLARHHKINAIAYCSRIPLRWSFKSRIREFAACTRAVIDVYILNTQPKFLGKKEPIQITSRNDV